MESSITCEVCFTEYNSNEHRPKALPCGHTICASCVKDMLKAGEGQINCPFCRNACGIGVKTVDDFPTTFALLNLLANGEQKKPSKTLSPKEREKEILQQKKQVEYDRTGNHISNCNEHLSRVLHAKETQESAINRIRQEKNKLVEEQKRLEEEEKKAISVKHQLDDIAAEGNDIVKGLESSQDRVRSAGSLLGLNMASQDVQKYYTASQDWVSSRVKSILKGELGDTHLLKENRMIRICQKEFAIGEFFYSCLQCQTDDSIKICGSCFVNSEHLNHKIEIRQSVSWGFCYCGISEVWKSEPTCMKHLRRDKSPIKAFDTQMQSSSKCKEVLSKDEKSYSCLECRTRRSILMCGNCFLNSAHRKHTHEIQQWGDGAFCDCGNKDVWTKEDTCKIHS